MPVKKDASFFLPLTFGAFLPYLYYGFLYLPILDDYIQYGAYPLYENLSYVYCSIGTLSVRPLANLLDPLFWGHFWQVPGLALFIVTLLHLVTCLLFYKISQLISLPLSPLFFVIFLLAPLGMEGRYWLSASSRLVVGLFFAALSLWVSAIFLSGRGGLSLTSTALRKIALTKARSPLLFASFTVSLTAAKSGMLSVSSI